MKEKILEEYSVKIYEIDPYFYEHCKEKIKVDKNEREYILFRIDIYFTEYFLSVKIDEQNHEDRELIFEKKRQEALVKKISCKFIRINTSNAKKGYDTDYKVSKIQTFISKFKEKNKRKSKQNKRARRLNKEIKISISKPNYISSQKFFTKLQGAKKTQSKIKPIKTGKERGTTYCLGCKDFTHIFRPQEVKMINKVLREKANCVVCW